MRIGIIGCGRVGTSFGKMLSEKYEVVFFSEKMHDALYAADKAKSMIAMDCAVLVGGSDVIFITVPDQKIEAVWNEIKDYAKDKIVCHMSGALTADEVFKGGEKTASLHPVMAVSSPHCGKEMADAVYTVEGSAAEEVKEIFDFLDIRDVDSDKKTLYHASCVFASNLVQAVMKIGKDSLTECGFEEDEALGALKKLAEGNVRNIFSKGLERSLTGPVDRNDVETVKKHLEVLSGDEKEIYRLLSKKLLEIAEEKHDADYTQLRKELD